MSDSHSNNVVSSTNVEPSTTKRARSVGKKHNNSKKIKSPKTRPKKGKLLIESPQLLHANSKTTRNASNNNKRAKLSSKKKPKTRNSRAPKSTGNNTNNHNNNKKKKSSTKTTNTNRKTRKKSSEIASQATSNSSNEAKRERKEEEEEDEENATAADICVGADDDEGKENTQQWSQKSTRITDPSDIRLDSMIQILRRATLLKKQQSIIINAMQAKSERIRKQSSNSGNGSTNKEHDTTNSIAGTTVDNAAADKNAPQENSNNNDTTSDATTNDNNNNKTNTSSNTIITVTNTDADNNNNSHTLSVTWNPNHENPMLSHDLTNVPQSPSNKTRDDLFNTHIGADGSVLNVNPLLKQMQAPPPPPPPQSSTAAEELLNSNHRSHDNQNNNNNGMHRSGKRNYPTIGEEFGFGLSLNKKALDKEAGAATDADGNDNPVADGAAFDADADADAVEAEAAESARDDKEKSPPTPPQLFVDDHNTWRWNSDDILIEEKDRSQLLFIMTLNLIYLGITNGPLFPNSILKWQQLSFKTNAPTPRSSHVSAFLDNKMIIFGGNCTQMLTDHIFVVNTTLDENNALEVTPISSLEQIHKTYRVGHCGVAITHNNCLYLYGGWNDETYINYGLLFNVNSLKLVVEQQKERILPPARRDHTLVKMGPFLLLFGGWSHDFFDNDLWCLGSNWKWQKVQNCLGRKPCPRRGHSASVIGSQMFVFGGLYGYTKYLNDLFVYNGDSNEWSEPQLIGKTRPAPRAWHSANVIGKHQILVFGGTQGRITFFNECWVFDTSGYFWFQIEIVGEIPRPRCSHTMVEVFTDRAFMDEPFCEDTAYQESHADEQFDRKCRLRLIMFGGLVPMAIPPPSSAATEEDKSVNEEESKENGNGDDGDGDTTAEDANANANANANASASAKTADQTGAKSSKKKKKSSSTNKLKSPANSPKSTRSKSRSLKKSLTLNSAGKSAKSKKKGSSSVKKRASVRVSKHKKASTKVKEVSTDAKAVAENNGSLAKEDADAGAIANANGIEIENESNTDVNETTTKNVIKITPVADEDNIANNNNKKVVNNDGKNDGGEVGEIEEKDAENEHSLELSVSRSMDESLLSGEDSYYYDSGMESSYTAMEEESDSESDSDQDLIDNCVNKIELSDDLYQLVLEM